MSAPRQQQYQCELPSAHDRTKKASADRSAAVTPTIMPVLRYAQWLRDKAIDRIQHILLGVLRAGPIPQHVAFVMDGNRRYARTKGMKVIQGHVDGFVALRRVRLTH